MPTDVIKTFRDAFAADLYGRPHVSRVGVARRGVFWVVQKNDWFRPCWFSITEYSPGCIRLRSDMDPGMPKSKWPFEKPSVGGVARFELTFHESELTRETHDLIFHCCTTVGYRFASPLFKESGEVPGYAWTTKANEHYTARRSKGG